MKQLLLCARNSVALIFAIAISGCAAIPNPNPVPFKDQLIEPKSAKNTGAQLIGDGITSVLIQSFLK